MAEERIKTLIVGGGIAGLTTAIALKRKGFEVKVVKATDVIKPVGAGLSLAANAMKALKHIGISNAIIKEGRELTSFSLYDANGKLLKKANTDPANSKHGISNFTIHRADLHRVLLSFLNNEEVILSKRTKSIQKLNDLYQITFEDNTILSCEQLIIAEGIHSPLRKFFLKDAKLRYSGYTCWRGIADASTLNLSETSETWGKDGRFGIVPLANQKIYWYACKNAPNLASKLKDFSLAEIQVNFKNFHKNVQLVLQNTKAEDVIWSDISDLNPIKQYAFENAVLIGDSAHATTPNMGQGACMAIEDAAILAECMAKKSSFNEAIRLFESVRLKRTHDIVNASWKLGKIAQWENGISIKLRNLAFLIMPQSSYQKQLESIYEIEFKV
jgi:2-polyprenyl-6-methoxyphenol hydroxylase-like FAD-dependent oxidoreductase